MFKDQRHSLFFEVEGKKIFAMQHNPQKEVSDRVVVFCHGFGGNKIGANRFFVTLSKAIAESGISVIRFDLRGCGDSEGDFCDVTIDTQLVDLLHVLKDARANFKKIGLVGVSLGSLISLLAAPQLSEIKSLAFFAPLSSHDQWLSDWENAQKYYPETKYLEHRGRPITRHFFEQFFDVDFERSVHAINHLPLLHAHGDKDTTVPVSHRERFQKWRKNTLSDTKFISLPNSDHGFSDDKEQKLLINHTVNWFLETL